MSEVTVSMGLNSSTHADHYNVSRCGTRDESEGSIVESEKAHKRGIHPGFETQGRRHQKSKTGVSVVPQKGLVFSKNWKNRRNPQATPVLSASPLRTHSVMGPADIISGRPYGVLLKSTCAFLCFFSITIAFFCQKYSESAFLCFFGQKCAFFCWAPYFSRKTPIFWRFWTQRSEFFSKSFVLY